jgi:hypothetical protein
MTRRRPVLDRILEKLDVGFCWIYLGEKTTGSKYASGYGTIRRGGRYEGRVLTHRAVWEGLVGPIPDGLQLDHVCRVKLCCNPDHLEPVTPAVNVHRSSGGPGKPRKTHCKQGHEFTDENTKITAGRFRNCRACCNAASAKYYQRKRMEAGAV